MNPFTTEHPLTPKSSWFDAREHPKLSFVCRAVVLALVLTPFVLLRLYYYAISDIGAEPNPFPEPCWILFWGTVIAFVFSLLGAFPVVFLCRLATGKWRLRYGAQ
jgi:hypothetical protein